MLSVLLVGLQAWVSCRPVTNTKHHFFFARNPSMFQMAWFLRCCTQENLLDNRSKNAWMIVNQGMDRSSKGCFHEDIIWWQRRMMCAWGEAYLGSEAVQVVIQLLFCQANLQKKSSPEGIMPGKKSQQQHPAERNSCSLSYCAETLQVLYSYYTGSDQSVVKICDIVCWLEKCSAHGTGNKPTFCSSSVSLVRMFPWELIMAAGCHSISSMNLADVEGQVLLCCLCPAYSCPSQSLLCARHGFYQDA